MAGRLLSLVATLLICLAADCVHGQDRRVTPASATSANSQPKLVAKPMIAGPPALKPEVVRVVLIIAKNHDRSAAELTRLNRPGGDFEALRAQGWKVGYGPENQIQIVDRDEIPELVSQMNVQVFPTVAAVSDGKIIRAFRDGCTTPLDAWTFGWLYKGRNERPYAEVSEPARVETTGNYRLRGNHWSVDGDWNPPKSTVVNHLRSPIHAYSLAAQWRIEAWSYEELRSLHDDLHEREMSLSGGFSSPRSPARGADNFSANRKINGI